MNWDDLRILECCARTGSFAKASAELVLSHSSISRRMTQLESDLDITLLRRTATGVTLTDAGSMISAQTRGMAAAALAIRNTSEDTRSLKGRIRLETIDATGIGIMDHIKEFTERHPEVEIDLRLNQHMVDLGRGEADIVLRATNAPPDNYIGYRIAYHAFGIFGATELINRYPPGTPLNELPWVLWSDGWSEDWMASLGLAPRQVIRVSTANGVLQAIRKGLGIGHMACKSAAQDPNFLCLRKLVPAHRMQLWLLMHESMKRNQRVRAFTRFLRNRLVAERPLFEGEKGTVTRPLNLPLL